MEQEAAAEERRHAAVTTHTEPRAERLPAASAASTSYGYVEPHLSPLSVIVGSGVEATGSPSR